MSIHGLCPLCAVKVDENDACPEHGDFRRKADTRSDEEKLVALWRQYQMHDVAADLQALYRWRFLV